MLFCMKKHGRRLASMICTAACTMAMVSAFNVSAYVPYRSFHYISYQSEERQVECPAPFLIDKVVKLGLSSPGDICIGADRKLYLADTGNSRILVLNADGIVLEEISSFTADGEKQNFQKPEGVFADQNGNLYVADTENNRVVVLTESRQWVKNITVEENDVFGEGYVFYPRKLAVDSAGRLFVVARGQVNGIMQFTPEGNFSSFVGSNRVVTTPFDMIWRQLMTKEQREKTVQFIPLEYSNLYMDDGDFIYAVTQATDETKKVKRLNPGGTDILPEAENMAQITEDSQITCICADQNGNFYYTDQASGCVYVFQSDGNLLYAFGGKEDLQGNFKSPSAIRYYNDKLYVLDSLSNTLTVFSMADYAKSIQQAGQYYRSGEYDKSLALYKNVLKYDSGFDLAYIYMGRIYYQKEDYQTAMEYFRKGTYRGDDVIIGYGKALEQYQGEWMRKNLHVLLPCLVILVLLAVGLITWLGKRTKRKAGK